MSDFLEKKRYEGVRFNVISVTRGWVGVQFPEKKRYVTLEWPHSIKIPNKLFKSLNYPDVDHIVGWRHYIRTPAPTKTSLCSDQFQPIIPFGIHFPITNNPNLPRLSHITPI